MEITFIRRNSDNRRLILIFTGWSTGPELFTNIEKPGWDVAVAHDFSELDLDTAFLDNYATIYLFAWSFGVYAAHLLLPGSRITAAFATNGTVSPVSDSLGIPTQIFLGTSKNLSPRNLAKFRRRMMPDAESCRKFFPAQAGEDQIEGLRRQLARIFSASSRSFGDEDAGNHDFIKWRRAYISSGDLIFPPENMKRAWGNEQDTEIVEIKGTHYVDIGGIISSVIADTGKVSGRFAKASSTYDSYALAQQLIARRLSHRIEECRIPDRADILEIGPGTGYFTGCYAPMINAGKVDFVDISPVGPFGIFANEHYHQEDAELWISRCSGHYDVILSASAIQWFADVSSFFANCARILKPGGFIAVSTFAPGNLAELDAVRPSPLLYPSVTELKRIISRHFSDVAIEETKIELHFESHRQMLMHLKHTGVAGSAASGGTGNGDMLRSIRTLTYRPVFIVARNPPDIARM